jgi:DNA ligase 1
MEPMLAGKFGKGTTKDIEAGLKKLRFPVMVSPKLDGIRALVVDGVLMSRSMKPIPNRYLQKKFGSLPNGTDGELIKGLPTEDPYRNTVSAVMTEDGEPTDVCYFVFDNFKAPGGFAQRSRGVDAINDYENGVVALPHQIVDNLEELLAYEEQVLESGYEGVMIRSLQGPYKFGRSSANEGYLLKLKRFEDGEAVIIGTEELEHNDNVATKDAFGRTERSNHKAGMRGAGVLGALVVRGVGGTYDGVEFNIGSGFTGAADPNGERAKLWRQRDSLVGKVVKFKYFPIGSKDKPRFPTFLGFRDKRDM